MGERRVRGRGHLGIGIVENLEACCEVKAASSVKARINGKEHIDEQRRGLLKAICWKSYVLASARPMRCVAQAEKGEQN